MTAPVSTRRLPHPGAVLALIEAELARRLRGRKLQPLPPPHLVGPSETVSCAPGLYEADQIGRVTACGFRGALPDELAKLDATVFQEAPLERYDLGPSLIVGGRIVTRSAWHLFRDLPRREVLGDRPHEYGRISLLNSQRGMRYFGHWLRDDCALHEALRDMPSMSRGELLSMRRAHWPDCAFYETAFGHDWPEVGVARIADLTLWRDQGFSRDKAARLRRLRARLRQTGRGENVGQIVYLGRGRHGVARDMANRDAFETALQKAGIRVLEPGRGGAELSRQLLDAAMIVTIEGSQASHGVYNLAEGGAMLILQPPDRFYNPHHEWCRLLGMSYGVVVGKPGAGGFSICPDEVLRMVDRLVAQERVRDA